MSPANPLTCCAAPNSDIWTQYLYTQQSPVLTWHAAERIELGGPVMARWLAKTDNLLVSEFPYGAGQYQLELPISWQRFVWELALTLRGWEPVGPGDEPDLIVSNDTALLDQAALAGIAAYAHSLEPLVLSWPGELPFGIEDALAAISSHGDHVENPGGPGLAWTLGTDALPPELAAPAKAGELRGQRVYLPPSGWALGDPAPGDQGAQANQAEPANPLRQIVQLWAAGARPLIVDSAREASLPAILAQEQARVF